MWTTGQSSVDWPHGRKCTVRPERTGSFQGPSCFNPHGLAWSPRHGGRLFVADADNNAIIVLDATSGTHVRTVYGSAASFDTPRGVAITPTGALLVSERMRVLLLSPNGRKRLAELAIPAARNMLGISVDGHRAYVADPGAGHIFVLELREREATAVEERLSKELR